MGRALGCPILHFLSIFLADYMIWVVLLVKKRIPLVIFPMKKYLGSPQRKKPFFLLFLCILGLITPEQLIFLIRTEVIYVHWPILNTSLKVH
jgi:hypothetical protein